MATAKEIKKVILDVAGNPDAGVIVQFADAWAEAIANLDAPASEKVSPKADATGTAQDAAKLNEVANEKRVTKVAETR